MKIIHTFLIAFLCVFSSSISASPVPPFFTRMVVHSPFFVEQVNMMGTAGMDLSGITLTEQVPFNGCDGDLQATIVSKVQSNALDGGYSAFVNIKIDAHALKVNECTSNFLKDWKPVLIDTPIPAGDANFDLKIPQTDTSVFSIDVTYTPLDPEKVKEFQKELDALNG